MSSFVDDSTECAICFEALSSAESLTLRCGHKWHLSCLTQQLQHARPDKSRRLLLTGCRCAKCGVPCDHPQLEDLTRPTDRLRGKVDAMVTAQLEADAPRAWAEAKRGDGEARRRMVEEGRRGYAFYLCGLCDEPYFGGTGERNAARGGIVHFRFHVWTQGSSCFGRDVEVEHVRVECADEPEGEEIEPLDRRCPSCSPPLREVCQRPVEHRAFHVWKCRYCCRPSQFVCYGNVHFCGPCHERNTERTRILQGLRRGRGADRPALEAIPCPGAACPQPKREGQERHSNGPSRECEQVYRCACCESAPSQRLPSESGSRNFVFNPSGEHDMRSWGPMGPQRMGVPPGHTGWKVEASEVPADANTRTNFVSGCVWGIMAQKVEIHRHVREPSSVRLEVSAKYMGRTDCPSVFKMEAFVTDRNGRIRHRASTPELVSPADFWEKATLTIDPVTFAHDAHIVLYGKDQRFWAGDYGAKVCHCSVRVLCEEEEVGNILIPADQEGDHDEDRPVNFLHNKLIQEILFFVLFCLVAHGLNVMVGHG
ncbi:hypothetical protein ACHAWF_005223 [Thalassiosira exigua]